MITVVFLIQRTHCLFPVFVNEIQLKLPICEKDEEMAKQEVFGQEAVCCRLSLLGKIKYLS